MLLATAAKDVVASIPLKMVKKQVGEIYIVGIKSEE